nr:AMP-binding protein [Clostridia bacterium]
MDQLKTIAARIKELRSVTGKTAEEMAAVTNTTVDYYLSSENGENDFSFTFIHNCAKAFNVDITDLLAGDNAKLSSHSVVRHGEGLPLERRKGFKYSHLASNFKDRLSEPFLVKAVYEDGNEDKPISLSVHKGEEFDYVLSGQLRVNINGHENVLGPGDAVYYNSDEPHGMVAVGGDCEFLAVVIDENGEAAAYNADSVVSSSEQLVKKTYWNVINALETADGELRDMSFTGLESYNFAYDVVDVTAKNTPDKLAMLHLDHNKNEKRFTFGDMSKLSSQAANYFKSLGIKKGDRVMLVLKRHYQFWLAVLGLEKIGAIFVPASNQLMTKDYSYRFESADISAIMCCEEQYVVEQVEGALPQSPKVKTLIIAGGKRDGWNDFDEGIKAMSDVFERPETDAPAGYEPMLMYFSSGTTGYPKAVVHNHLYSVGHFVTAKYWHNVREDHLHFTISDTGWGKALWGKLYGQWLCGAPVFVYDFDKFDSADILPLFAKYQITTFCAPPTMYRFFIKENLDKSDLSSLKYATIAGEALNPEVFQQFYNATGIKVMEGFGQTETTLTIANLRGMEPRPGSMGRPSPMYDVDIVDPDGNPVKTGETGEVVVRTDKGVPPGLFMGYYSNSTEDNINHETTSAVWHDGMYHTGDTAWRDEDGYIWYVGRVDDLIKSSGYRIGPFEIESVIMELPYVLECAVTGAPDPVRGQVV